MMKKILMVFGTRPEAIKLAPLVKAFQASEKFDTKVCVTGQHREMLDQVLDLFEIIPDFDLDIMKPGQDLFDITIHVLVGIKRVVSEWHPDVLFVHGDTTTSMATCIAGFYTHTKVAHVEAGLRTYNLESPWPEEGNRQITGRLATLHFAPTRMAERNLISEGVPELNIVVTGNTVIDSLMWVLEKGANAGGTILEDLKAKGYSPDQNKKKILVTGHRRENFDGGFIEICNAIKTIADQNPQVEIIYPVHLNPNVQKPVFQLLSRTDNIHLIEPLDYLPFVYLMNMSDIVLTDSGGIQEEAPSLGKPVLVMRKNTERPEAVEAGTVKLIGTDSTRIIEEVCNLLNNTAEYQKMSKAHNPYGDGLACKRIIDFMEDI